MFCRKPPERGGQNFRYRGPQDAEIYLNSRSCTRNEAALLCALEFCAERLANRDRLAELEQLTAKYDEVLKVFRAKNQELNDEMGKLRARTSCSGPCSPTRKRTVRRRRSLRRWLPSRFPPRNSCGRLPMRSTATAGTEQPRPPPDTAAPEDPAASRERRKTGGMFDLLSFDEVDSAPTRLPELLAPAGSPEALEAAFCAGADAVYPGGSAFNARMSAHNFDSRELEAAVTYAHARGGRVYPTLNTLVYDRELPDAVRAAYSAAAAGVDGLIIADLGAAACIRRALPGLPLHASTQLSGHMPPWDGRLPPMAFPLLCHRAGDAPLRPCRGGGGRSAGGRGIRARRPVRMPLRAMPVLLAGRGRSGNRGECAQPCRLPYRDLRGACVLSALPEGSVACRAHSGADPGGCCVTQD